MSQSSFPIPAVFRRIIFSSTIHLSVLAVLVGLFSGAGIWLFKWLIEQIQYPLFSTAHALGPAFTALIPILGGCIVGLIGQFWIGEEKYHGTAGIMQSLALAGGRLNYRKTPLKTVAAILSIGSGASVGPEDPSVQIGAGIGSFFGQFFHLSEEHIRTLVAAGAAAAIAAAFNAPIAAVFFALEIILGEMSGSALGLILISSVTSAVLTQAISGSQPAFAIPAYSFHSIFELLLYLLLGLLAGPVSAGYVRLLYMLQDFFRRLHIPRWVKTTAAGAVVGITGIFLPQIFGVGYETIGNILNNGSYPLFFLLILLLAKLILTPISIGGGFFGGVFAPSLFLGATLGGAFGTLMSWCFPGLTLDPASFALVGMAAVLAGAVHAPLTAAILLFEMTGDYHIILPLMATVAVSLMVSQHIQRDSVYAMGLARHGIRIDHGRDIEVMAALSVGEVMCKNPETLAETLTLDEAARIMETNHQHGMPVMNHRQELVGLLTLHDIEVGKPQESVGAACTRHPVTVTAEETVASALQKMSQHDIGRLPVIQRDNPARLLGMLRRADIIRAYAIALERRTHQRHHEQEIRLDVLTPINIDISEMCIEPGSPVDGKILSDIRLPHDCIIASIQRGADVLVPRGDTRLLAGDILVMVTQNAIREDVIRQCRKTGE